MQNNRQRNNCITFSGAVFTSLAPVLLVIIVGYMFYQVSVKPLVQKGEQVADKLLEINVGEVTQNIKDIEKQLRDVKTAIDSIEIPTIRRPGVDESGPETQPGDGGNEPPDIDVPEFYSNFFYKN